GESARASTASAIPAAQVKDRAVRVMRRTRSRSPRARASAIIVITPLPAPRVANGTRTAVNAASCARTPVPSGPSREARILARRIAATIVATEAKPRIAVERTRRRRGPPSYLSLAAAVHLLVVLTELAGADRLPPGAVGLVPVDRLLDPGRELHLRLEACHPLELRRVDRVAPVVSRPVRHALQERLRLSEPFQDEIRDLVHRALVVPGDVERVPLHARRLEDRGDRAAVVEDVDPVARVPSAAVDRERLVLERVGHEERDQLLGILVGTVVVAAARHDRRHVEGCEIRI